MHLASSPPSCALDPPALARAASPEVIHITPQSAEWDTISMTVVRLMHGQTYDFKLFGEEAVVVVLGGKVGIADDDMGAKAANLGRLVRALEGPPAAVRL